MATGRLHSDIRAETLKISAAEARRITAIFEIQAAAGQPDGAGFLLHPTLSHASPCGQSTAPRHPATLNSCVLN
jgi:hypothetical protein